MEPLDLFTPREVLSVSDLVGRLKRVTEESFDFVWVEGEVSALRRPASGHLYFSLKDDQAVLRAVLFRHQAKLLRFSLEEGQKVLCQGRLSVYQQRGDVQLIVDAAEPRGAGALALAFEQLKKRLAAEGLFDAERKAPIPELPHRVAVVTSPGGAAIRDFLHVLHRRFDRLEVAVYPVQVQGDSAPGQMIAALAELAAWGWPEVIVLTRGGGSPEDLWAFNDEGLARAIAACPIPTISAVGHEVDLTISDLVADLRAPTPSAAAELLVAERAALERRLAQAARRLAAAGQRVVEHRRSELKSLVRALGDPRRRLADKRLRVDDLLMRASAAVRAGIHEKQRDLWLAKGALAELRPDRALAEMAARRRELERRLAQAAASVVLERRRDLDALTGRLRALSPLSVLGRGYALARDREGRVIRRADQVNVGDRISLRLGRGGLAARVEEVEP